MTTPLQATTTKMRSNISNNFTSRSFVVALLFTACSLLLQYDVSFAFVLSPSSTSSLSSRHSFDIHTKIRRSIIEQDRISTSRQILQRQQQGHRRRDDATRISFPSTGNREQAGGAHVSPLFVSAATTSATDSSNTQSSSTSIMSMIQNNLFPMKKKKQLLWLICTTSIIAISSSLILPRWSVGRTILNDLSTTIKTIHLPFSPME